MVLVAVHLRTATEAALGTSTLLSGQGVFADADPLLPWR
jgi:hypothetical protein